MQKTLLLAGIVFSPAVQSQWQLSDEVQYINQFYTLLSLILGNFMREV